MKSTQKKLIYSCVGGCIVLMIILVSFFDSKLKEIPIQESLVREKVKGLLPIVKETEVPGFILETNITAIDVQFDTDLLKFTATGCVSLNSTGVLEETKALINNVFKKKKLDLGKKMEPKKIDFTLFFSGLPIYGNGKIYLTIDDLQVTELKLENLDILVGSKGIIAGAIVKVAKLYLDRFPLYKLPDDFKGAVVRASLKELEFQSEVIIIHFFLFGLFGGMVWWFFCLLAVFIGTISLLFIAVLDPSLLAFY